MSRAVGTTVGLYTIMCIAWIPLSFIVFGEGQGDNGNGVAVGCPLTGVGIYSALLGGVEPGHEFVSQTVWMVFWILAYSGFALAPLLATLGTFNRCLGRVNDPTIVDDDRVHRLGTGESMAVGGHAKTWAADPLGTELWMRNGHRPDSSPLD